MRYSPSCFIVWICFFSTFLYGSVEHKDDFIDIYLANISSNLLEKTELLQYIQEHPTSTFLDIGTGGDAIAHIASMLPSTIRPTLIAADIDPKVIESIKKRRPEVNTFINSTTGPKVDLVTMSATKMTPIKDSSVMGIGASALMHEVHSYVPTKGPLDQFISELCRTLEKEGVFIYRDPLWVDDPQAKGILILNNDIAKFYTVLFISKLLDRKFSQIVDYRGECCKPLLYRSTDVIFNAYPCHSLQSRQPLTINFEELLKNPSKIDYSKSISIEAPMGLIAEIQRHYLMYLKNYNPLSLIDKKMLASDLPIRALNQEQQDSLVSFLKRKSIPLKNEILEKNMFSTLTSENNILRDMFHFGCRIKVAPENKSALQILVESLNIFRDYRAHIYFTNDNFLVIDPLFMALQFRNADAGIFKLLPKNALPLDILEHLKLEGEEHYYYLTTDQLITYLGQYSKFELKDGHKAGYLLAPISPNHIKNYPRTFYQEILNRDMVVMDLHGNVREPITDKSVIHFQLQPESTAYKLYKQLIRTNPSKYSTLAAWMNHLEKEELDLVSENDEVIGKLDRDLIYQMGKNNYRVVNAFIINSQNQIWIPKRHPSKKLFPLCLDSSVGGHVRSGETYEESFMRETKEEVGLDLNTVPYKLIAKLTPETHKTSAFMNVYAIYHDGPIPYNQNDFINAQWMNPEEVLELIEKGIPAKGDLKILLENCFHE